MKRITKTQEPSSLSAYRASILVGNLEDENIYDDFLYKTKDGCKNDEKGNLRKQLLEEQGYVCCYCMSRVSCKNSKIEHFKDQSTNRNLQIDYQNLFISCNGNKGKAKKEQFCDNYKGNQELNYISLLSDIEKDISYKKNGRNLINILSKNSNIDNELNNILNLNNKLLSKNRKETYNNVIAKLKISKFSILSLKKTIGYYKNKHNNKYEPFSEMIIYFLTNKLKSKGEKL